MYIGPYQIEANSMSARGMVEMCLGIKRTELGCTSLRAFVQNAQSGVMIICGQDFLQGFKEALKASTLCEN